MAPEDAPAAAEIERLSSPSPWSPSAFERELRKGTSKVWVAVGQGRVRGFICVWFVAGEAQVAETAVHPDFRRIGVGRALLRRAWEEARRGGAALMTLEVRESNQAARRLYESEGFVETFRRPAYYEGKEAALLMEKRF